MTNKNRDDEGLWSMVKRTATPLEPSRRYARVLSDGDGLRRQLSRALPASTHQHGHEKAPPRKQALKPVSKPDGGFTFNAASVKPPLDPPMVKKISKGKERIEARLDLHGMTQDEAYSRLVDFLAMCFERRLRTVMVITGKGFASGGILRHSVPLWLAQATFKPMISGWHEAARHHGGSGALYVRLRQNKIGQ